MGRIWCLDVGCADASAVVTGSATFLIDCHDIGSHEGVLPKNKHLRGVFITLQHDDHYSGLEYLAAAGFGIDYLICSPYERRYDDQSVSASDWQEFQRLTNWFEQRGTKNYKPYRQSSFAKPWWDTNGARFWMLAPFDTLATSRTRTLHDACLVLKVDVGKRSCLFTGDASDKSLQAVADDTKNICDDILHASHHGSLEGANLDFIKKSAPKYTMISTKAGVHPSVPHATALKRYRDHSSGEVYRTDHHGTIYFEF